MLRRRNARGTVEGGIAGAFSIRRLGGSRRGFGRTIALWGLNRRLIFAAPSVLVPPDQSTHLPPSYFRVNADAIRPDKPKTYAVRLSRSDFVQVGLSPRMAVRVERDRVRLDRDPQLDPVVRRVNQILLCAEVSFGRLHRCVAQQQLDLLQFAAGCPAHFRARATIMPHAALSSLCRIPDYAESMSRPPIWRAVSEFARESDSA